MLYNPHPYQDKGTTHILDNSIEDTLSKGCFFTVGTGKSVMSLTALDFLLSTFAVNKPLIIGPARVISHTWPTEIKKWDHTKHLKISVIHHTSSYRSEQQRIAALNTPADVYAISRDNIAWLVNYCAKVLKRWPFDLLIIDELSNFKNPAAQRFKAVRKILPYVKRVIGLTGTPAPNQLLGLWAQVYLLDKGKRLGQTYGAYKEKYFMPGARNGHVVFNYVPKPGAEQQIYEAIGDICLSMKASDYLDLPPRYDIYQEVELQSYERYKDFKKSEVLMLSNDFELTPVNAASMYGKLLQYCNGAVYKGDGTYEIVDNTKLEELCADVEALEGDPVFIVYQFQSDYERFVKSLPGIKKITTDQDIDDWNAGKFPVACAQIQSLAYGVNLQQGGNHLYHFGLGWDLELYLQFVGRIDRQGKEKATINKHFVAKDSIEQVVIDRLAGKLDTQEKLMFALKKYHF